ncbi:MULTISPECIES: glycosyltransferase [unclassified Treponema]|uniref:glycosyltransferase n=1 Tax=unclassified Treponema TaxID=2638727 RepID=UPI0005300E62|nr:MULTISPECIES: glycosyltransferase [unclassified Treponema]AIW89288.1 glycosyl transferase [Treponema sp. OMZ 838]UTC42691.1 glycosyltransferase family 4 protein [Treponema sp. OMZ 857]UTC50672.1 glycosyltransferase [Treponema sp. OMZ 855]
MRIAIIAEYYLPAINGVVYHMEALRTGLIEAGHEVLIVKPDFNTKHHHITDGILYSPAVKLPNLYDYCVSYPYSKSELKLLQEWKPDILHIHTEFSQGMFALYAARRLNIPIVYTCHTMYYDYMHYLGIFKNLKAAKNFINWSILKYTNAAKAVICASTKMEDFLKQCKVTTPIYKIPNACITSDFSEETLNQEVINNLKIQYAIKPEDFIACFCGRLASEKNLSLTLEYWKQFVDRMPNAKLFIIGNGPARAELEQQAQDYGLTHSVIFTGAIPHETVKYYYHLCDAYIMTSLSENHSVSALEAMACGLPVVHLYDKDNEDQYIEGLTGFAFKDSAAFVKILHDIYDKKQHAEGGETLKEEINSAMAQDNYQTMAQKIAEVYQRVLAETHNP